MADSRQQGPARNYRRGDRKKAKSSHSNPSQFQASGSGGAGAGAPPNPGENQVGRKNKAKNRTKAKGKGKEDGTLSLSEMSVLRQTINEFKQGNEEKHQLSGLNREQRSHVHRVAQSMGLKTQSKGPEDQRVLTITRPEVVNQPVRVQNPKILLSTMSAKVLDEAQKSVERLLARRSATLSQKARKETQHRRPNNFGLVGLPMIPPHPSNRNSQMMQERQSLPIYGHRSRIVELLQREQVLIIQGATGSGKSTQLPQYLLEWAAECRAPVRIVVSQPRRIAATSVSERISKERGEVLGNTVGYQIRMNSKCSSNTILSLTTSGCLLRALAMDGESFFRQTTHLIIDEVHERDLDTDFLLLATKMELQKNRHLRLVLMSATMDLAALSKYFGNATVMDVEGRSFGVKICQLEEILKATGYMTSVMEAYLGEVSECEDSEELLAAYSSSRCIFSPVIDNDLIISLLELLIESGDKGAVIVYLPGYQDMTLLMERLKECLPANKIKIMLLHSQVESNEQRKAFHVYPEVRLKIILSTNIGQTSITIPDLLYVIDAGRAKMQTYDPATDASQLASAWISQADAQQRAGRAGRLRHGVCYRLYSTACLSRMSEFTIPEMMRRPLDEICLLTKMAAPDQPIAGLLSMALDPPQPDSVVQACSKLQLLGVLEEGTEKITLLGRIIAELPLGVQQAKCVVYSIYFRCLGSMTIIAAYHSVRDPFVLQTERGRKTNQQNIRMQFGKNTMSDSLAVIELYKEFLCQPKHEVAKYCESNSLCRHSMDMFVSAVRTLRESVRRIFSTSPASDRMVNSCDADTNMVRLALTAGLYPKVAFVDRENKHQLMTDGDSCLQVSRNSCLLGKKKLKSLSSDWILYVEKSRNSDQRSTLEHTSLVSGMMIAIAGGKHARLEERDQNESLLCLDSWVRIAMPTVFAEQLLKLRKVVEYEIGELVENRKMTSMFQWIGPDLIHRIIAADTISICLVEGRGPPPELLNCDNEF
ncbi:hypothetical protein KR009_006858 [Drosophila setifemur]|nr:hypothetical protein KR009_006858 [Drosophila setifemur]